MVILKPSSVLSSVCGDREAFFYPFVPLWRKLSSILSFLVVAIKLSSISSVPYGASIFSFPYGDHKALLLSLLSFMVTINFLLSLLSFMVTIKLPSSILSFLCGEHKAFFYPFMVNRKPSSILSFPYGDHKAFCYLFFPLW